MKENEDFIRRDEGGEGDEFNDQETAPVQPATPPVNSNPAKPAEAPNPAKSDRPTAAYEMEQPEEIKLPEGVKDKKRGESGNLKRAVGLIAFAIIVVAVIGGVLIFKSFRTNEEKVEVKNSSGTTSGAKTQGQSDETQDDTIQKVKEVAAAQASVSPTPNGQPSPNGQPGIQNGSILNQPGGNVPQLIGQPIYDTRGTTTPNASATPDANAPGISRPNAGNVFGGGNQSNRPSDERQPSGNQPVPEQTPATRIEVPTSNGSRTLYFLAKNESSPVPANPAKFIAPLYKPPFGAVLPVRLLGSLHTLQSGGLARLELTRTVEGNNWRLARGTIFVGRVQGGADKRLFVSVIGYIEPRSNSLIEISGDTLGRDGAIGFEGEKKQLHSRWKKVFSEAISKATQLGSAYLLGRNGGSGSVINTGNLGSMIDQANPYSAASQAGSTSFVVVSAGANGYIMINNLPPSKDIATAPFKTSSDGDVLQAVPVTPPAGQITDDELLRILTNGSPEDIRRAFPRMSPEWQNIAKQTLQMRDAEGR